MTTYIIRKKNTDASLFIGRNPGPIKRLFVKVNLFYIKKYKNKTKCAHEFL